MDDLTLILGAIFGFCCTFYLFAAYVKPYAKYKSTMKGKRVLLVTSHPDDEVMFFGPTILSLIPQQDVELFILCMSTGDYEKKGKKRKTELYKATEILGIPKGNITLLKYSKLKDDPRMRWREELVSEVILHHVEVNLIDVILTFDRHGVSGHKNHCSLYNAMAFLSLESRLPAKTSVYTLRSVNFLRKYVGIIDVPMSFLLSPTAFIASLKDWWTLQRAMAAHYSQYVWYRKLYMMLSRYILINTYDQMNIPALEQYHKKIVSKGGKKLN